MNTQNNFCPKTMINGKFALSFGLYDLSNNFELTTPIISGAFKSTTVFENDTAEQRKNKLLYDLNQLIFKVNQVVGLVTRDRLTLNQDGTLNLDNLPDYIKK